MKKYALFMIGAFMLITGCSSQNHVIKEEYDLNQGKQIITVYYEDSPEKRLLKLYIKFSEENVNNDDNKTRIEDHETRINALRNLGTNSEHVKYVDADSLDRVSNMDVRDVSLVIYPQETLIRETYPEVYVQMFLLRIDFTMLSHVDETIVTELFDILELPKASNGSYAIGFNDLVNDSPFAFSYIIKNGTKRTLK